MSTATSPRSRYGAKLAFDPAGQRLILHGGRENVSWPRTDTWAWDGTAWPELLPDSVPDTPRASSDVAVLYDSARRTSSRSPEPRRGTVGTGWRPVRSDAAPEGRPFPAVVFDATRSEIVLFGGGRDGVAYGDMWRATFDGDDREPGVDRTAPLSTFTSEDAAALGAGEAVAGRTVDAGTGTRTVHVVFAPVADELTARSRRITVVAILTCIRSRTECTWLVEVPDVPGTYVVTARATDAAGNVETVGARTVVTRAV